MITVSEDTDHGSKTNKRVDQRSTRLFYLVKAANHPVLYLLSFSHLSFWGQLLFYLYLII